MYILWKYIDKMGYKYRPNFKHRTRPSRMK